MSENEGVQAKCPRCEKPMEWSEGQDTFFVDGIPALEEELEVYGCKGRVTLILCPHCYAMFHAYHVIGGEESVCVNPKLMEFDWEDPINMHDE